MRVRVTDAAGTQEFPLEIQPDLVMQGRSWHPGVAIPTDVALDGFTQEWVCYSINEGGALFAEANDLEENCPVLRFTVVEASSEELATLGLLTSPAPEGAELTLDDGRTFWSRFGQLTGGNDERFASMADLGADFKLAVKLTPHLQAQERMVTLQAIVAKLAETDGGVSIRDGIASFEDGAQLPLRSALAMPADLDAMIGGPVAVKVAYLPPSAEGDSQIRKLFFDRLSQALVRNHAIVTIGDRQYRYARKDEVFLDGDLECTPAATGIFVRNPVTRAGAPDTFAWMYLCSDGDLDQVLRRDVEAMTENQREAALVNLSFAKVLLKQAHQLRRPKG